MGRPLITRIRRPEPARWRGYPLTRAAVLLWLALLLAMLAACTSPEATRSRGGGAGADVGNHGVPITFHDGAEPYHETPCVTEPMKCEGPMPVFGASWTPD
jgi:hypothetical protein